MYFWRTVPSPALTQKPILFFFNFYLFTSFPLMPAIDLFGHHARLCASYQGYDFFPSSALDPPITCTLTDTINIASQLIRRLRMVVKKIDSWLLQLPVLLIAIGSLNLAADFTSSDWICGTFNVIFMVSVSVHLIPDLILILFFFFF
jgi:hypothetical protein